ncbi:MAG: hypothetical protein SWK76_05620 [Actinomycetota bacterium]|nr:hypothetical protein [Actinomycetota bacterium]
MKSSKETSRKSWIRRCLLLSAIAALLLAPTLLLLSCGSGGNATTQEREELKQALLDYWEYGKDYSLGFTNALGDIGYAEVEDEEATVDIEVILGYTRPTEGAGYRMVTFRLRRYGSGWEVTYDGWVGKELY